jgi:hypothetical protein
VTVSFDGVFSSIASMYRVRDHSLRGYCALVQSILKLMSANGAILREADLDLVAKIVRPLTVFNDEQSRRVTIGSRLDVGRPRWTTPWPSSQNSRH